MAVCACACFWIEHFECVHDFKYVCICQCMRVCVCGCRLPKSRNGRHHSSASLNRWHWDQSSGSVQTSYWLVTAWTRPLHFPACCWSRLTPHCSSEQKLSDNWKWHWETIYGTRYTHPRAREISSSWVLCSGCPFSADFSLYCWTSWATWFSWFNILIAIITCSRSQNFLQTWTVIAPSPTPSPGSFCRSLSPLGGAPDSAVHLRQQSSLLPPLATWAVAGVLLSGSGRAGQTVLPMHQPPSASSKSYWQPVMWEKMQKDSVYTEEFSGINLKMKVGTSS